MELDFYQKEMWSTIENYMELAQRRENIDDAELEEERMTLLLHIVSINEKQKEVLAQMRRIKGSSLSPSFENSSDTIEERLESQEPSEVTQECPDQHLFPIDDTAKEGGLKFQDDTASESSPYHPEDTDSMAYETYLPSDDLSKEKAMEELNLDQMESEMDASQDLTRRRHDLVSTEEFMHSIGLLTIRECDDVLCKRKERYRKNKHSHIFSTAMWEKPDTKRKRRDWLSSDLSPPQLRRKNRGTLSQPSSRQPSRPSSPIEGSSSPSSSISPIPPASPNRNSSSTSPSPEEECQMCNRKGAPLQCDGCGVCFHIGCMDIKEEDLKEDGWLCLTCERIGLKLSLTIPEPSYEQIRKEELLKKEAALHLRAQLTLIKQELQEKKDTLSSDVKVLEEEHRFLEERKCKTFSVLQHLKNFVSFFKELDPSSKAQSTNISIPMSSLRASKPFRSSSKATVPKPNTVKISCIRKSNPISISPITKSSSSHGRKVARGSQKCTSTSSNKKKSINNTRLIPTDTISSITPIPSSVPSKSTRISSVPTVSVEIFPRRPTKENNSRPLPTKAGVNTARAPSNITLTKVGNWESSSSNDIPQCSNSSSSSSINPQVPVEGVNLPYGTDVELC